MKQRTLHIIAVLCVGLALPATALDTPTFDIPLDFTNVSLEGLGIGLDATASQGLDSFDNPLPPGSPTGNFGWAYFSVDVNPPTNFAKDVRPLDASVTWRLEVFNGNPPESVVMSWQANDLAAAIAAPNNYTAEIRSLGGALLMDMSTGTSFTFTGSGQTVLIVFSREVNVPPVAFDDHVIAFASDAPPLTIDVLANDVDGDGDALSIDSVQTTTDQGGQATVNGDLVNYFPPAAFIGDDTFTYTVSDGNGGTDEGSVTVSVFAGDVVARRFHGAFARRGAVADANVGLLVNVTISLSDDVRSSLTSLELKEILPITDSGLDVWKIASGAGVDGLDISGATPPTAVAAAANEVTFTFDTGALPAGDLTFSYRMIMDNAGQLDDVLGKAIDGDVLYDAGGGELTSPMATTSFVPVIIGLDILPTDTQTSENGIDSANFDVALLTQPTADVTVTITVPDSTEGVRTSAGVLTFTSANWDTAQTVTVDGVNDDVDDGNIQYDVRLVTASAGDAAYNAVPAVTVTLTNLDDDTAGITVTTNADTQTDEAGDTATFTVVLDSEPISDVTVALATDDTQATLSPTLTFTAANWDSPQTVTVTGIDDDFDDDNFAYEVTLTVTSSDPLYNGFAVDPVGLIGLDDDDTAGITVTPTTIVTSEDGGSRKLSVALTAAPRAATNVTLTLGGDSDEVLLSATSLPFDSTNWNVIQMVTVTGQDDTVTDGNAAYTITLAFDYDGVSGDQVVTGTNADNDIPGLLITGGVGLTTDEDGATAAFTVALATPPTDAVTVTITGLDSTEGTLSDTSLVFGAIDFDDPQTVTITGIDDTDGVDLVDGDVSYTLQLTLTSADGNYNGKFSTGLPVTNLDTDVPATTLNVVFSPQSINFGDTVIGFAKTFSINLSSTEAGDTTFAVTSGNGLFTLDKSSLTVPAGSEGRVFVTYTPTGETSDSTQITFTSGAFTKVINVNGRGIQPSDGGILSIAPAVVAVQASDEANSERQVSFTVDLDTSQAFQQFGFRLRFPADVMTIDVADITPAAAIANNVIINIVGDANNEILFQYFDFSGVQSIPSGTVLTIDATVANTLDNIGVRPLTLFGVTTSPTGFSVQLDNAQLLISQVVANLDVDESGDAGFNDIVLIFRRLFVADLNFDTQIIGDTELGLIIPDTLQEFVTLPAADIVTNINALLPLMDVDESGDSGFNDIVLIFRFKFVADLNFDNDVVGETELAQLIPSSLEEFITLTPAEVADNIRAILP